MQKEIVANSIRLMGDVVGYIIWARILISIFARNSSNIVYRFLVNITEPILAPLRNFQTSIFKSSMFDFSPIFAWCLIDYVIVPILIKLVYIV